MQPNFKDKWATSLKSDCNEEIGKLIRAPLYKRKAILEKSTIGLVGLLKDCSTDILTGRIKINKNNKNKLVPHARTMRKLASKHISKMEVIKLLLKKNFLDVLLRVKLFYPA